MNVGQEIAERVEKLTPQMQEQVLRFVSSLEGATLKGENGSELRRFAFSLDDVSAQQMTEAIEEECERVDASEW